MRTLPLTILLGILACPAMSFAQPVFTGTEIFPPEEFAARRAKVVAEIGDAVAILQGTTERPGEQPFRQSNQFFYLTGVVEPRAIAVIDGRTKKTTIFLQPFSERRDQRMYGPSLHAADAVRLLGVDSALGRDEFARLLPDLVRDGRAIYTPMRPEVLGESSSGDPRALANATKNDPWDGRISREEQFIQKLKAVATQSEIKDLDPVLDRLREIKSPREIALIREATRMTGLAIMESTLVAAERQVDNVVSLLFAAELSGSRTALVVEHAWPSARLSCKVFSRSRLLSRRNFRCAEHTFGAPPSHHGTARTRTRSARAGATAARINQRVLLARLVHTRWM